jgi:hypothetical protein
VQLEPQFLPPSALITVAPLAEIVRAYEEAARAAGEANRDLARVERSRNTAEQADAEDLARSIEENKPAPKPRHVQKHEQDLAEARRVASATSIVRGHRWSDVEAGFAEFGDALAEDVDRRLEERRAEFLGVLDELTEQHRELCSLWTMKAFCSPANGRFRPQATYPAVSSIRVHRDRLLDGDQLAVPHVLALLGDLGRPPDPPIVIKDEQAPEPVTLS